MLGHKLSQQLKREFEVFATIRGESVQYGQMSIFQGVELVPKIDVVNTDLLYLTIKSIKPDVIINAVGIIKQLPDSKNNVKTITINALLPHQLASYTTTNDIRLINISTDCVFDGKKGDYRETDPANAEDLYGRSKHLGEVIDNNCLTLRTSIIGRELFTSHSLVEWFLSQQGKNVRGFVNAIYTGFPTTVLAEILKSIITEQPKLSGLLHISSDKINKFELLELIKKEFNAEIRIEPFEDFHIDRSLDSTKFRQLTGFQPPAWEEMIKIMAEDSKTYEDLRK